MLLAPLTKQHVAFPQTGVILPFFRRAVILRKTNKQTPLSTVPNLFHLLYISPYEAHTTANKMHKAGILNY